MISGRSELEAIEAIFGERRTRGLLTEWPHLKRGLRALGVPVEDRARKVGSWSSIKSTAIVACGRKTTRGGDDETWHWVVYQPDGAGSGLVYDPLRPAPFAPDGRTRTPFSYLPVSPVDV
jgi:hypothetical protein